MPPNTILLPLPQPNTCKGNLGLGMGLGCLQVVSSLVLGMCKVALSKGCFCFGGWLVSPVRAEYS